MTALLVAAALALVSLAVGAAGRASLHQRAEARLRALAGPVAARPSGGGRRVLGRLAHALDDAALEVEPHAALRLWLVGIVVLVLVGGVLGGAVGAALTGVAGVAGPPAALHAARHRRRQRLEQQLGPALEAVAAGLRGGRSLAHSIDEAAATGLAGPPMVHLADAVRGGVPLAEALDGWAAEVGGRPVRLAATALALAAEAGGTAARAVDGVAATLREHLEVDAEARALAAQARLSATVIAVAPLAFAAVAAATDPRTTAFLLGSPFGLACLVLGVLLDVAAFVWMRRIVQDRAP